MKRVSVPKKRPSRLRKWMTGSVFVVLLLATLLFIGWRYIAQNWNADQVMRRNVIPTLEAQLGQSIEVGSVETNYLSWVRLHHVVVGRDAALPGGALLTAKQIDVRLNIPVIALGKRDTLSSISSATLQKAVLYVERDKDGAFNLSKLISSEISPKTTWTGTIRLRDGTIIYHDLALLDVRKKPLDARLGGIDANVRFDGNKPIVFDAGATKVLLNATTTLSQLKLSGSVAAAGDWLQGKADVARLPAALFTSYILHNKIIAANTGDLAGKINFYWKQDQPLSLQGIAQLSQVGGTLDAGVISPKLTPLPIKNARGVLEFQEHTLTLRGLQLQSQNSPLALNGVMIYGIKKPAFNIAATSSAFQFTDWGKWLQPALGQNTDLRGLSGAVSLRMTGNADLIKTTGTLNSRNVTLREPQLGTLSAVALSAGWNGHIQTGKTLRANLMLNLKGSGTALNSAQGNFKAAGWQGKLQIGKSDATSLKGQFQTTGISGKLRSGETLQSSKADISLLHQKSTFVQLVGNNSVISSSQLGRLSSGYIWAQAEINEAEFNLQSQLRNYKLSSAQYGNADGKALQLTSSKKMPLDAKTPWLGKVLLQDADLQQLNLAAISPQLKNHIQDIGHVNGSAQFIWDAQNPQITGQFLLSQVTVLQDEKEVLLRDMKSTFSYAQNRLLLNQIHAKSSYGDLQGQLSADLKSGDFDFLAQAERARFNAQELNPYLAAQDIVLQGTATGKLWLSATSQKSTRLSARFDLQLPASKVLLQKATHLQANNGHLQGRIKGTFTDGKNWNFETQMALAAKNGLLLQQDNTARLGNFRLTAEGNIDSVQGTMQPKLQGTLETAALKMQSGALLQPVALAKLHTKWQWQQNRLEVPRIKAQYANGVIDGQVTLSGFDQSSRSPLVSGEFLARDIQFASISQWLKAAQPQLLPAAAINGTGFAKATLSGSLDKLHMDLEAQAYKSTLVWYASGESHRVPLDKVNLKTQLLLTGGQNAFTIPLQELTVWSDGARVAAEGDLQYQPGKSTFAYDVDVSLDGLQLVSALRNLPLGQSVAEWQKVSDTDGVLNARLHVTGEGDTPQLSGGVGLRVVNTYDTTLRDVKAQVQAHLINGDPIIHLSRIEGTVAEAPFTADMTLNAAENIWMASADVTGLPSFELLDLSESIGQIDKTDRSIVHLSSLPLRGDLTAHFVAHGTVNFNNTKPTFAISDGVVKMTSPALTWHGEDLGKLDASLQLMPDVLHINHATLQSTLADTPRRINLSGQVPWNAKSTKLDTSLQVQNARISFLTMILDQTQQLWERSGQGDLWQQLRDWRNDLPPATEGNISLNANLTHSREAPRLAIADFRVRNASAQAPGFWGQGPDLPLPDVDAAGVYEDGTLTISELEARLAATDPQQEDLLLHTIGDATITPGGPINMELELLHGRLDYLALWIAALRNDDGSSALQGNVNQVALHVQGTTASPHVIGSFQANELSYRDYTLDRLRVSRFDIQSGNIFIKPGNFTVVKGDYQSSTGWGYLPWSWGGDTPVGLVRDKAMEVHLPLQNDDFGALTGLFMPAVTKASATTFRGSLDITGTLDQPRLNGLATIGGGKMVINTGTAATRGGLTDVSGTLRFENGNILSIDPTDPLRGRLISASSIDAPETGNKPKSTFISLPGGEPFLEGKFLMRGHVTLDMDALRLATIRRDLSTHHYDLQVLLQNASFINDGISGLRNANLALLWKTGNEDPALQQNVRWLIDAKGVNKKGDEQGSVRGFGNFALNPFFGTNLSQLLAVRSQPFTNATEFAALGLEESQKLFTALPLESIEGKIGNIQLTDFGVAIKDVGSGRLNGQLNLTNSNAGSLRVAGTVTLSESELEALPAETESSEGVVWPRAPLLDVRFDLGEDVRFSSSNLKATLGGYLNISGTPYDPLLLGTLDILRGEAIFPGARARITEGEITITARRDLITGHLQTRTEIDATAEGRSGRYLITLHLHGPLDMGQTTSQRLMIDISSDPPLSRDEAFSQLLGISVLNDAGGLSSDQDYAQAVIGLLSGTLFSGIEGSIARSLGLSSVALDYQLNQPLGIEVGKAIGDKLYLSYRRSIGKDSTNTTPYEFRLEYRVKGGLQLGLKFNEQSQATVTLEKRWRF